jgi:hypothetical protein
MVFEALTTASAGNAEASADPARPVFPVLVQV